jgi:hypothetical protein
MRETLLVSGEMKKCVDCAKRFALWRKQNKVTVSMAAKFIRRFSIAVPGLSTVSRIDLRPRKFCKNRFN